MSEYRAASRYAKSLLLLAEEKGVLEDVHKDMLMFSQVCDENRSLVTMLKNPIIKHHKKRDILKGIFGGKVNDLTMAIFEIITKKNREPILPLIAKELHNQYNVYKRIEKATVVTALPLTDDLRSEFEKIVKQVSAKDNVELIEKVDKDIIGGFVLKVGDRQIDDSIKSKLKSLRLKFSQNPYIKEF